MKWYGPVTYVGMIAATFVATKLWLGGHVLDGVLVTAAALILAAINLSENIRNHRTRRDR